MKNFKKAEFALLEVNRSEGTGFTGSRTRVDLGRFGAIVFSFEFSFEFSVKGTLKSRPFCCHSVIDIRNTFSADDFPL